MALSFKESLAYFWQQINNKFVLKETGKGLSSNDFTTAEKEKLETTYTHAVTNKGIAKSAGLYKITTNSEGHLTAATAVVKSDITALGIPAQDTTYSAITTTKINEICV